MSTYSRQSSSSRHGVSVSRLTASMSTRVSRQSIFSRSSMPTRSAKLLTIVRILGVAAERDERHLQVLFG